MNADFTTWQYFGGVERDPTTQEIIFFGDESINGIIATVEQLVKRKIAISKDNVRGLLASNYYKFAPAIGDFWSRFNQPTPNMITLTNPFKRARDITINMIVAEINTNMETLDNNNVYSIWNTAQYNDYIKPYQQPKLRLRRPQTMLFNFQPNYE